MGEKREDEEGRKRDGLKVVRRRGEGGEGFGRRPRRRRVLAEESSSAIQRLFEVCRAVFRGPGTVPTPENVDELQLILDELKLEDFGLSTDLLFFKDGRALKGNPTIIYTNVYNCNNFSMCIFFLPPAAIIPLHNHPGMTVFSKLLLGSMHVKSYDWIETSDSNKRPPSAKFKLAKLVVDSDFTASCKTSILYPTTGGNIHTFRAITSCVLLDILGPPYSKKDDRDCAYYKDHPYFHVADGNSESGGGDGCIGWLEEIDFPEYLKMEGIEYLGPQIVED
ncbi:cysteamine dioxygenase [Apostasia shenzhenica]|uniref:cysteine dioxygenase n=1 Tax=Apostasia shenzhenica TaxID=1088818 RepID=A0A2I0AQ46_9ASPA|nr:cysteamine dioxygenase [Apostasia shenzhenica]